MRLLSGLAGVAALLAATCFAGVPAEAKAAHTKKVTKHAGNMSKTTHRRADRRRAPRRQPTYVVWHGWTGTASTFHLDGVAYRGGNRRGPRAWYNNYEGGFHPEAFWVLHLRSLSG
jgi:hypothetical protein